NRHFWGEQVVKAATIWPLTTMIISQTDAMIAGFSVLSLYNYVIHANLRIDFGKWSWVLNAPAYHRRHHSKLPEHFDSNFAALFPVFDVIFGTYRRPDGWPPTGQATAPRSLRELLSWPHFEGRVDEVEAEAPASTTATA
ncbi:MAG: sterol desaturase family protein, partial [Novosphingobium sp.]